MSFQSLSAVDEKLGVFIENSWGCDLLEEIKCLRMLIEFRKDIRQQAQLLVMRIVNTLLESFIGMFLGSFTFAGSTGLGTLAPRLLPPMS